MPSRVVSLLSRRGPFDINRLLQRGKWKVKDFGHHPKQKEAAFGPVADLSTAGPTPLASLWRLLGVNDDFSRGDKAIYIFKMIWVMGFFAIFVAGSVLSIFFSIPDDACIRWWGIKITITVIIGVGATAWFLIGGVADLGQLIRSLRDSQRHSDDDGSVHTDADELVATHR